ncbi:MAG: ROK family protein [Aquabacterium sp.]
MSTPDSAAIGIDLGGTKIEALLIGPDGRERWRRRVPTPRDDYRGTVQAMAALVQEGRAQPQATAATVGMAHPGAETAAGLLKNANSTCLNGQPLRADLQAAIGTPLAMANDANCLALSEATDGAGAGAAVVFAVILGTGVGGGLAMHGRVLHGANGLAGEWGHNPLPWASIDDGPPQRCYCGQWGCIETWCSGPALARRHALDHPTHLIAGVAPDASAIAAAAQAGDARCQATIVRWQHRLARALASIINIVDPDVIVLGGGLSGIASTYVTVPALWSRWVVSAGHAAPPLTRLALARHGDASGVRGAAWLGRDEARQTRSSG